MPTKEDKEIFLRDLNTPHKIRAIVSKNATYFENLNNLRKYYEQNNSDIMAHHATGNVNMYRAYPCDWSQIMSPIELTAWQVIRSRGRLPLYPQYPVGKYFLDFGNPFRKIGVELDGKDYHDKAKDYKRDMELRSVGWDIIRITGSEMNKMPACDVSRLFEDENQRFEDFGRLRGYLTNTGEGILDAVRCVYFGGRPEVPEELEHEYIAYCQRTIEDHILLNSYRK